MFQKYGAICYSLSNLNPFASLLILDVFKIERGTLCARVIFTKNTTFQKVH